MMPSSPHSSTRAMGDWIMKPTKVLRLCGQPAGGPRDDDQSKAAMRSAIPPVVSVWSLTIGTFPQRQITYRPGEGSALFPLRQIEAWQLVGIGLEVELLGEGVGVHIGVDRQPVSLLGGDPDRGRIGLEAHRLVGGGAALGDQPL